MRRRTLLDSRPRGNDAETMRRVLPAVLLLLLSACGQAGDLYLPGEPAAIPAPPAAPADDDQKKKETK
jgi:predicted small lipoprotein YifL